MTTSEKIKALRYLFRCYFHVDWTLEYDSEDPSTAIKDFLREDYSIIAETYEAITWLLNHNLGDKRLQEFFDDHVGEYDFFFEGEANSFLRDIQLQLIDHLGTLASDSQGTTPSNSGSDEDQEQSKDKQTRTQNPSPPKRPHAEGQSNDKHTRTQNTPPPRTDVSFTPYVQQIKELSILIAGFLVAALFCLGIILLSYIFFHMLSMNQVKNVPSPFHSPTPTQVMPQKAEESRVLRKQVKGERWEFRVHVLPGRWFDTGIPLSTNTYLTITGEQNSRPWIVQIGDFRRRRDSTSHTSNLPIEEFWVSMWDAPRETVMPAGEYHNLEIFLEGAKTADLKVVLKKTVDCRLKSPDEKHLALHRRTEEEVRQLVSQIGN